MDTYHPTPAASDMHTMDLRGASTDAWRVEEPQLAVPTEGTLATNLAGAEHYSIVNSREIVGNIRFAEHFWMNYGRFAEFPNGLRGTSAKQRSWNPLIGVHGTLMNGLHK